MMKIVKLKKHETEGCIEIDPKRLVHGSLFNKFEVHSNPFITRRSGGEFEGKALYLDFEYDWVLGEDKKGCIVLIPLEKE
jgi:hypothetical protein